jgi:hypothetical protein
LDNLQTLYAGAFSTAFIQISDDGKLVRKLAADDEGKPCTMGGKKLVISGPNARFAADQYLVHPLIEPFSQNENPVLEFLRTAHQHAVHLKLMQLITDLLVFGSSPGEQHKQQTDLGDVLRIMAGADAAVINTWKSLMTLANAPGDKAFRLVQMNMKRQATLGGHVYPHACIVTFPLYEELIKGQRKIGSVGVSVKSRTIFKELMEYVLPGIGTPFQYSSQGTLDQGPRYSAVLGAVYKLLTCINEVAISMTGVSPNLEMLVSNLDWEPGLKNFSTEYIGIARTWMNESFGTVATVTAPALASGNSAQDHAAQLRKQAPAYVPAAPTQVSQAPVHQLPAQEPVKADSGKRVSYDEWAAKKQQPAYPGVAGPSVMYTPDGRAWHAQPAMQPAQPQMPAQAYPQPALGSPPYGAVGMWTNPQNGKTYWIDRANMLLAEAQVPQATGVTAGMVGMPGMMPAAPQMPYAGYSQPQPMAMGYPQAQAPMGYNPQPQMGYPQQYQQPASVTAGMVGFNNPGISPLGGFNQQAPRRY